MTEPDDSFELFHGTGNVYIDTGHPNPELAQERVNVAIEIMRTLDTKKLSTRDAERLTGISHTEFSRIRRAQLRRFTLDRLITILNKLDETLEVKIKFRRRPSSHSASAPAARL